VEAAAGAVVIVLLVHQMARLALLVKDMQVETALAVIQAQTLYRVGAAAGLAQLAQTAQERLAAAVARAQSLQ